MTDAPDPDPPPMLPYRFEGRLESFSLSRGERAGGAPSARSAALILKGELFRRHPDATDDAHGESPPDILLGKLDAVIGEAAGDTPELTLVMNERMRLLAIFETRELSDRLTACVLRTRSHDIVVVSFATREPAEACAAPNPLTAYEVFGNFASGG